MFGAATRWILNYRPRTKKKKKRQKQEFAHLEHPKDNVVNLGAGGGGRILEIHG